jgi:eukaryotic-like serine/threonine-protein kinase
MPAEPNQVKAIFCAALEKSSPAERAVYLAAACGDDAELRQRVEVLLAAHDRPGSFLDHPPAVPPAETSDAAPARAGVADATVGYQPPEAAGTVIGPYKLLQQLGEGGMGTVFLAEQRHPVVRKVALKVIKAGLDSAHVIARFEQERQALALMDHPNIARVLDAGATEFGRPYFVMELVKGIPITKYCDQEHLTPQDRLQLFVPVCQAVQHAHQKGVIHRDLKPSNVLVALYDGRPVPKIIDFGVAKATQQKLTERTMFTEVGQMVGTLEYMAPEQAELNNLDIDTRADIYSLGVLLYELLTGSPPFLAKQLRSAAFTEMMRIIREVDPPRPSTRLSASEELPAIAAKRKLEPARLTKLVAGDLDWIVMKALEKERGRRYETANGLAQDVARYLSDEPVQACPPSARYRLKKFLRRNKRPVTAAGLLLAALLIGIVGTTWGLIRALRAEAAIQAEQTKTQDALENVTAEQVKSQTALAAETAAKRQTRDALEALTDVVVETAFSKQDSLGAEDKKFLQRVIDFYEGYARAAGDTPEARRLKAEGYLRVGRIRERLGEYLAAEAVARKALAVATALATEFPETPDYRDLQAEAHAQLGEALQIVGPRPKAESELRQAVALREQLVANAPPDAKLRARLAAAHLQFGAFLRGAGSPASDPREEEQYRKGLAILEQLVAAGPESESYRDKLALAAIRLADIRAAATDYAEASRWYQSAQQALDALVAKHPNTPAYRHQLSMLHNNYGVFLGKQGKRAEEEGRYRLALNLAEQLAGEFPGVPLYRSGLALTHGNLGKLLQAKGDKLALEHLWKASAGSAKLAADHPTAGYRDRAAAAQLDLAHALRSFGRSADAGAAYRLALDRYAKLIDDYPARDDYRLDLAQLRTALGVFLYEQKKWAAALTEFRAALALREPLAAAWPKDALALADNHRNTADTLEVTGKRAEALVHRRAALAVAERAGRPAGTEGQEAVWLHKANLAFSLAAAGQTHEARTHLADLAERLGAAAPSGTVAARWRNVADGWAKVGDLERGVAAMDKSGAVRIALAAKDAPKLTDFRELHDADDPTLIAWMKDLPAGFRPMWVTAHAHADPPRFNAVAIRDGDNRPFDFVPGIDRPNRPNGRLDFDGHAKAGWRLLCDCPFAEQGKDYVHRLWVMRPGMPWSGNGMTKQAALNRVTQWKKENFRPTWLMSSNSSARDRHDVGVIAVETGDGQDWELHFDLTGAQLAAKVDDARKRGWRPDVLHAAREGPDVVYSAVFVSNPLHIAWQFRRDLDPQEYAAAIKELRARRLRPLAVTSYGKPGAPKYTAVWIDYTHEHDMAALMAKAAALRSFGEWVRDYDPARAVGAFRKWRALAPGHDGLLADLACALGEAGAWEEAVDLFQQLQQRQGRAWDRYLCVALTLDGRVDDGAQLASSLPWSPGHAHALLLELAGHSAQARKKMVATFARDETAMWGAFDVRTACLLLSDRLELAKVQRTAELTLKKWPGYGWAHLSMALVQLRLKRPGTGRCGRPRGRPARPDLVSGIRKSGASADRPQARPNERRSPTLSRGAAAAGPPWS